MGEFIRNNIAYNSQDEMDLAAEIPAFYLYRRNDAGYIAEAVINSYWLSNHDAKVWENGLNTGIGYAAVMRLGLPPRLTND